jgi:phosphatidylserine decarboxylase
MSVLVIPKDSRMIFGGVVIVSGALWGAAVTSGNSIVVALAILATLLIVFMLFFFRDPERIIPEGDDNLVSPCDGLVISIDPASEDEIGVPAKVISVFMSIFDVHVNRNVCSGKILEVEHRPGRFGHAGKDRAAKENEQNRILIEHISHRVMVTQVAGVLARRIICRLKAGDTIDKGERFGMIVLGSRLMVTVPDTFKFSVKKGQRVHAGETILGVFNS